jgi:hypothetical protein
MNGRRGNAFAVRKSRDESQRRGAEIAAKRKTRMMIALDPRFYKRLLIFLWLAGSHSLY